MTQESTIPRSIPLIQWVLNPEIWNNLPAPPNPVKKDKQNKRQGWTARRTGHRCGCKWFVRNRSQDFLAEEQTAYNLRGEKAIITGPVAMRRVAPPLVPPLFSRGSGILVV